jgi:hypothetical protein
MSLKRRGAGGKRDSAEKPIVDALRAVGARVLFVSGQGNPDLFVRHRGSWTALEVKTNKGRLTHNQQNLEWAVVRTPEEALAAIGVTR